MAKPYLKLLGGWTQEISPREQGGSQRIQPIPFLSFTKIYFNTHGPLVLLLLALLGKFSQENSSGSALDQIDQSRSRRSPPREPAPDPEGCRQSWDLKLLASNGCITCLGVQQSRNYGRTRGNFSHWPADFRNSGQATYGSFQPCLLTRTIARATFNEMF